MNKINKLNAAFMRIEFWFFELNTNGDFIQKIKHKKYAISVAVVTEVRN
ncbi:hypothetical protein H1P_580010 [Hyella patelloides LEGE 07179]|uniref:Uncharacterized protein n=1 Tax=Hyella patelloides LEGE 07179 TaxID=945734 RepID=A0A563W143_9CYAN|nr:hypothetical protein [Hyella patelloides]VEP17263.1 hypothetical protein H1P_580010 [Hyella patelloides LEGE 07179]